MTDTLAGASPVDQPVRPLSARLDVLRVLLAERHPDHHETVAEAQAEIERLRTALMELTRLDPPDTERTNVRLVVYGQDARQYALKVLGLTRIRPEES